MIPVLCCMALFAADLPVASAAPVECHGTLGGERFWLRLSEPKAEFGGNRVLHLVYTPPTPAQLGGAHLPDCPFVLLDQHLRIVAWNGRDTLSQAQYRAKGYAVTREVEVGTGTDAAPAGEDRTLANAERGWDERLAPVLLTLAWRPGQTNALPVYDLFGPAPVPSQVSWSGEQIRLAGRPLTAVADAQGRLARLTDASGAAVLTVTAWTTPPP
jgi:hypothetical protein